MLSQVLPFGSAAVGGWDVTPTGIRGEGMAAFVRVLRAVPGIPRFSLFFFFGRKNPGVEDGSYPAVPLSLGKGAPGS